MTILAQKAARIHELRTQLKRFPQRLNEARRQLDAEQRLLDEVRLPWEAAELAIQQKEATVKLALETVEKFEQHMKKVTTQKEFQAASKQVDEARRLNQKLQNEILELKVKQEETLPKLNELRERHRNVLEEYTAQEKTILAEQGRLEAELSAEEELLKKEAAKVGSNVMPYYERLTKAGRNPAIVPVVAGKCTGCNMALPPQAFNQLLARNGSFMTCSHCTRIIYYQAPAEPPKTEEPSMEKPKTTKSKSKTKAKRPPAEQKVQAAAG
jgi:hypothetical protein